MTEREDYFPLEHVVSGTLEKYENGILFETIVIEDNEIVQVIKHLEE